ncbi:fumarate hydratase [Fervidobacterium thailandense]|uniref:Fumarate hydratase n=1 Tax=Fervidobacterium thailandense TaxID=1008305 RepID=A0A1E3G4M0_9BACT|nr:fumarate hydratase [Fervidobacterium thailandense]
MVSPREIYERVKDELIKVNVQVSGEVEEYFQSYRGPFRDEILKNFVVARCERLPLCQDTGLVEFFVFKGVNILLEEPISLTLNRCVADAYAEAGFRKSIVREPICNRVNTGSNTPCIVHLFEVGTDTLEIFVLVKGGGSENLTRLLMLEPGASTDELIDAVQNVLVPDVANACPPVHVGIGLGGSSDLALLLSRLALFDHDFKNFEPDIVDYPELSEKLKERLNSSKIGVQALGVGHTVLKVRCLGFPTHIATLPVAVSVDCFLNRTGRVKIR